MLKKISSTICCIMFILLKSSIQPSDTTTGLTKHDQVGALQFAFMLWQTYPDPAHKEPITFIGETLLGNDWESDLSYYHAHGQTDRSLPAQDRLAAHTRAYCIVHNRASEAGRTDVTELIQHGQTFTRNGSRR